jgi:hypothetical protein
MKQKFAVDSVCMLRAINRLSSSPVGLERSADQMLLSSPICNVNAMDNDQTTPLIMAALQGNAVICESLVRRCSMRTLSLICFASLKKTEVVVKTHEFNIWKRSPPNLQSER